MTTLNKFLWKLSLVYKRLFPVATKKVTSTNNNLKNHRISVNALSKQLSRSRKDQEEITLFEKFVTKFAEMMSNIGYRTKLRLTFTLRTVMSPVFLLWIKLMKNS